jgi:large subunit ribosomal protein L24e
VWKNDCYCFVFFTSQNFHFQQFRFCRSKCKAAFNKKKNPRKTRWTKTYRKINAKELTVDPSFEFEKKRNVPVKYDRELWTKTIASIKKINEIRERREKHYVMERLRKGTQREIHNDIRNVQKNLSLIRAPEGIRKKDKTAEQDSVLMDQDMEDEENIQYVDARELEKKLSAGKMEIADTEMIAN